MRPSQATPLRLALMVALGLPGAACKREKNLVPDPAVERAAAEDHPYDEAADAETQLARALEGARRDGKNVLVEWGGNWCIWCRRLHVLFRDNARIHEALARSYVLVLVDANSNEALAQRLGADVHGVPYLTVLDASGAVVTHQKTGPLEKGAGHDVERVLAFLMKNRPRGPGSDP